MMIGTMLFVPPAAVTAVSTLLTQQSAGAPPAGAEAGDQEIVVSARPRTPNDPMERVNALSFSLTNHIDEAITAPASRAYASVVPKPVRHGLRNFFANLREPVVFANYLLQLKPGKAFETAGRFAINSTMGLGGTLDVATRCPFNLPRRQNGFSETLGLYGVKPGPFLFVPVAGPTTVRDIFGGIVDVFASPAMVGGPFRARGYVISSAVVRILDRRDRKDEMLDGIRKSDDPYAARRDLYLERQRERVEALHGDGPSTPPPHRCRRREDRR